MKDALHRSPPKERSSARPDKGRGWVTLAVVLGFVLSSASAGASGGWVPPPPSLPAPPPGSTCITIQRGTLGNVFDSDLAPSNGNWAPGAYPLVWTGLSSSEHWALIKGDLSAHR